MEDFNQIDFTRILENIEFINQKNIDDGFLEEYSISVPLAINIDNNILGKSSILELITNQVQSSFYRKVVDHLDHLFNSDLYDVIDFRGRNLDADFQEVITNVKDISYGYKNIICSNFIGSLYQDSANFYYHNSMSGNIINITLYTIGTFDKLKIWVDPYMRFNDTRLICLNDFDLDIKKVDIKEVIESHTFVPKIVINIKYKLRQNGSKVIYLFNDISHDDVFSSYKKIDRSIKINKILGDS